MVTRCQTSLNWRKGEQDRGVW